MANIGTSHHIIIVTCALKEQATWGCGSVPTTAAAATSTTSETLVVFFGIARPPP
ncbi:hypothetical protein SLEP1_g35761 [Rubroshorea leprosula]|uniref:Uncharacterized protein n=1 Tax=Rubroshorea leprosula TaxID=152421 RepID=A0AAV5KPC3_9ROSI|nr:hypothetical protein SLEP1_g35761 [Rubroshorea leprosula]